MEMCRACMNSSLSLVDIFSEKPLPNDQRSLADMVNKFVDFKVMRDDLLPQKMCESCCIKVQIAFRFKLQVEQCHQLLNLQIKQIQLDPLEIKIEVEPEETTTTTSNYNHVESNSGVSLSNYNRFESSSGVSLSNYNRFECSSGVSLSNYNRFECSSGVSLSNYNRFESSSGVSLSRRTSEVDMNLNTSHHSSIDGPGPMDPTSSSEFLSVNNMEEDSSTMLMENEIGADLDNATEQVGSLTDSEDVQKKPSPKNVKGQLYKCELCPKTYVYKRSFDTHMIIGKHLDERPYKCTHCEKTFQKSSILKKHTKSHNSERAFKEASYVRIHKLQHTGEHPYSCDQCPKTFISKHNFNAHIKMHTGERPFKCTYCGKSFIHRSKLRRHTLIHTGERPFKCENCHSAFTQHYSLHVHMAIHTGERATECSYCKKNPKE